MRQWIVAGFIVVGILSRLVPHPWNATPLMAIALFGGTYLSKRWAIALPLIIIAFTDLLIGFHSTIPFTWSAFALTGLLGYQLLRDRTNPTRILILAISSSMMFFLISNFGVWATQNLYPKSIAGLWQCYVAAIPFFRSMLIGDIVYTTVIFGLFALFFSRQTDPNAAAARA